MSVFLRRGLLVLLTALVPVGADACCLLNPFNTCGTCGTCGPRPWIGFTFGLPLPCCAPCGPPPCGPVCPPPCGPVCPPYGCGPSPGAGPTLMAPIPAACNPVPVCTTLEPRQVTTYQTVPTTQIRREAYVANVPVTTYQQITVPRTVYQPQTRYRDVAYTVNQQVARTHVEYVPRPVVGYGASLPVSTGCATCDQTTAYAAPQATIPAYAPSYPVAPYVGGTTGSIPTPIALPPANPQASQAATLQQPQPYAEGRWQPIPQRQAQENTGIQQMGGFYPSYSPPQQAARSMFQPAPSAASVWQTRWMR